VGLLLPGLGLLLPGLLLLLLPGLGPPLPGLLPLLLLALGLPHHGELLSPPPSKSKCERTRVCMRRTTHISGSSDSIAQT
jgi:hypothetical protein